MTRISFPVLLLSFLLLSVGLVPPTVAAPRSPEPVATGDNVLREIHAAGEMRLQSQRLAKLWLQGGLAIQPGSAGSQLARGIAQFDAALGTLAHLARRDAAARSLQRIQELWVEYRLALALPYNERNLTVVGYLAEDLMLATGRLVLKIESPSGDGTGRLLDLSLRNGMLAQRLARLYLMAQAGDRSQGRLVDIEQARKEFATSLGELNAARENTPASREALELANTQWLFFDRAISEMSKGRESRPQHVATSSERIVEVMAAVGQQYAQDVAHQRHAAIGGGPSRN